MTNIQLILSVTVSLISVIGTVIGVMVWFNKKANNRMEGIALEVGRKIEISQAHNFKQVETKIESISVQLKDMQTLRVSDEQSRLRDYILLFSSVLKFVPETINEHMFANIFQEFERYKKLGGNGYIDEEMCFIRKIYREIKDRPRDSN